MTVKWEPTMKWERVERSSDEPDIEEMFNVTPPHGQSVEVHVSCEVMQDGRFRDAKHVAEPQIAADIRTGGDHRKWQVKYDPVQPPPSGSPRRLICVRI